MLELLFFFGKYNFLFYINYMKLFKLILFFLLTHLGYSQCAGTQTFTLTPPPVNNTYNPGQVVTLCYTLNSFTQTGTNWFEGFDLNLGAGWASVSPQTSPVNCGGNSTGGQWIWRTSVTSTSTPVQIVGPGYFFDLSTDGNPGNDFGDSGGCSWSFCVTLAVANVCTPQSLQIQVTAGPDGLWGSYTSTACDVVTPNTVFNGTINATNPVLGNIIHN
jgi:hypothetical protein